MENKTSSLKIIFFILAGIFLAVIIFILGFFFGQKSSPSQSEKVINDQAAASQLIPTPVSSPFSSPLSAFPPLTPSPISDETKDWKTYRNEKYGFEIKYPINWQYNDQISKKYRPEAIVGFAKTPIDLQSSNFSSEIYILVLSNSNQLELEEFYSDPSHAINPQSGVRLFVDIQPSKIIKISKTTGYKYEFASVIPFRAVTFAGKGVIYQILSQAPDLWPDKLTSQDTIKIGKETERIFNQMLSTFQFLD